MTAATLPAAGARVWLVAAVAILIQPAAWGQAPAGDRKAEVQAAVETAQKAQVAGPADVKLADQAVLKLPQGYVFIPAAEGTRLMAGIGNPVGEGKVGPVFSQWGRKGVLCIPFIKVGST